MRSRALMSIVQIAHHPIAVAAVLALTVSGCGSSERSAPTDSTAAPRSTSGMSPTTAAASASMRGERYCEVLVVQPANGLITADVYNSWPLNECPADRWTQLDATAIAAEQAAPVVLLNGPRYWLMDSIDKSDTSSLAKETFGGIETYRQATVELGPLAEVMVPYRTHEVDRDAVFTFDAGSTVYELHAPDGSTYVMQTWSQIVDPELAEDDLVELGDRLTLPAGWTYSSRTLSVPLRVVTTNTPAQVLQDDLRNSYSLVTR